MGRDPAIDDTWIIYSDLTGRPLDVLSEIMASNLIWNLPNTFSRYFRQICLIIFTRGYQLDQFISGSQAHEILWSVATVTESQNDYGT
jgi:hypothetical protein